MRRSNTLPTSNLWISATWQEVMGIIWILCWRIKSEFSLVRIYLVLYHTLGHTMPSGEVCHAFISLFCHSLSCFQLHIQLLNLKLQLRPKIIKHLKLDVNQQRDHSFSIGNIAVLLWLGFTLLTVCSPSAGLMCTILRFWGLSGDSARLLVQALVISGVDDSNSLLAGLQNDIRILTPPSLPSLWRFERFFCSVWTLWSRLSASSGVTFPSLSKTAHSLKKSSLREALYDSASLSPKAHICLLQYLSASFTKKKPSSLAFSSKFSCRIIDRSPEYLWYLQSERRGCELSMPRNHWLLMSAINWWAAITDKYRILLKMLT